MRVPTKKQYQQFWQQWKWKISLCYTKLMKIEQHIIRLTPKPRGFHLITAEIERQAETLRSFTRGIAHLHLLHTSASLTLNENADPDVREDMEAIFSNLVREREPWYLHTLEGPDDMPAHAKASLLGCSLSIPVRSGSFLLGTWQGVYLCEHRNHGGNRQLALTIIGD